MNPKKFTQEITQGVLCWEKDKNDNLMLASGGILTQSCPELRQWWFRDEDNLTLTMTV